MVSFESYSRTLNLKTNEIKITWDFEIAINLIPLLFQAQFVASRTNPSTAEKALEKEEIKAKKVSKYLLFVKQAGWVLKCKIFGQKSTCSRVQNSIENTYVPEVRNERGRVATPTSITIFDFCT